MLAHAVLLYTQQCRCKIAASSCEPTAAPRAMHARSDVASKTLRVCHELCDDLGRRLYEVSHAADADTRQPAQLDGDLGHFHDDGDAVYDRRAVDRMRLDGGEQQHGDAAAGDEDVDALGDQRLGLLLEQAGNFVSTLLRR